jgi:N-formylglutamate amidohydrolase
MSQIKVEAFLSVPPCSGGVAVKRLLARAEQEFGAQIKIVIHSGRCPEMEEQNINNAPALVIGDLVKFVGLAPSYESLVGALLEAGAEYAAAE